MPLQTLATRAAAVLAFTVAFVAAEPILAQTGRTSGLGQTGGGLSSGFGQGGFGASGFGQSGLGQSGLGQSGLGQSGFGQSGFGVQTDVGIRSGATGFVGRDLVDIQTFYQSLGRGSLTQQRVVRSGRVESTANSGDMGAPPVRVQLRLGRELAAATVAASPAPALAPQRVGRILSERGFDGLTTTYEEGAVRLSGVVANEDQRRLAEALASLEPGVRSVDNQLVIVSPESIATPDAE